MKRTKFQRITALFLTIVLLLCGGVVSVSANDTEEKSELDYIKELLNAISYNEYLASHAGVEKGEYLVIDATENYTFDPGKTGNADEIYVAEYGEGENKKNGLYTPDFGTVTWELDGITEAKRYSIEIEYYPVANKSASIERIFMINGNVPFAEARYLTISKIWKNFYSDGSFTLDDDESADEYLEAAKAAGIEAEATEKDGKTLISYKMPSVWTEDISSLIDDKLIRFFSADIDKNEIRSSLEQVPEWTTYDLKDSSGFMQESFEFVIAPDEKTGKATISLQAVNEPMVISEIRLVPHESFISYEEYLAQFKGATEGADKIKIEAEYPFATSSQTIYPVSDSTSAANSPSYTDRTVLNTIGGDKWQNSGQWIEYKFKVSESGLYKIALRFKQNLLDGMYTSRVLSLYSEGLEESDAGYYNGIPFAEAANLQFNYSSEWQSAYLSNSKDKESSERVEYEFYFEEDTVYTMRLEVSLGSMGKIVQSVQESLDSINNDYLNILKLTGSSPDEARDYGFTRVLPDTKADMLNQEEILLGVVEDIINTVNEKSSMTATLEKVSRLLGQMGRDDDEIAKNLEQLKTYIGSLGTWLSDAKTQPLMLDYICIQGASEPEPQAEAKFFQALWHEIVAFFQSFFRNYDRMGAMVDTEEVENVEVWLAYGRDQANVIRNLINNDFTPSTGITVDLKLVAGSTLLPSILSGRGPDVYIGVAQGEVINYAIRGALLPIEDFDDFGSLEDDVYDDVVDNFNEAAMIVLGIEDKEKEMHYYGLPETQQFNMMFIRTDILAELGIEKPDTWDDVKEAIPTLQANNMQIGMPSDHQIFIYQKGGDLFADDGMRINLDSNVSLDAFNEMCELFTMYSFPYQYDFANRFRTGEMPIGFAPYTATYNQLKVFATEIEGLWQFYPLPGYYNEETGEINNMSVSTTTAIVMITGCEDEEGAWEFMKWHAGADCQIKYSEEMVALLGPSAKHPTANISALKSLPWTRDEYEQIDLQFQELAAVPNYPGAYIVGRYQNFAFLAALNEKADPVSELQSYITTINKEITRKRAEFELETLDYVGQTLAQKRMKQAKEALDEIRDTSSYKSEYDTLYNNVISLMGLKNNATSDDYLTEDYSSLRAFADDFEEFDSDLFAEVVDYLRDAAKALESYEAYK